MFQYTTPTVGVRVKGIELDVSYDYQLTMQPVNKATKRPAGEVIEFDNPDVEVIGGDTIISVKLTQAQSSNIPLGSVKMQANWKVDANTRGASKPVYFNVEENLHSQVM